MKTLLLDVDGVLADYSTPVHKTAESILGRQLPFPADWRHFDFSIAMDMSATEAELFNKALLSDDNIGWKIDFYPGAVEFVTEISRYYDICFVTAQWKHMRHWCVARENLLQGSFPDIDVVFTHGKHRVRGDVLVDDKPENIMSPGEKCKGVLFDQPWNRNFRARYRAQDYEHLIELLEIV